MEIIDKPLLNSQEFDDMNYDERIDQLIRDGYQFKHGQYFSEGIEIFRKYPLGFIGYMLIVGIISLVIGRIDTIGYGMNTLGSLISMVISPPLLGGFIVVGKKIIREEPVEFGDFFKGFNYFGPLFLTNLLSSILVIIGLVFLVIPGIYLVISYAWVSIFVIIAGKDVWDSMESSRKVVTRKWWSFFGFFILLGLFNLAGLLLLGIGILFTAPISMMALLAAFYDILGGAKKSDEPTEARSSF